jgi:hypothetical protein
MNLRRQAESARVWAAQWQHQIERFTRRGSYSRTDRSAFRLWIGPCPEQRAPCLVERWMNSHCKRVAFFRECDPHATVSGSPLG